MAEDLIAPEAILGIVGIGASAGGLEALTSFVTNIPKDSGLCYVIVQHLAPDHPSIMDQLLGHHTPIKVLKIEDGMSAVENTIFVIPPGTTLTVAEGVFHLAPRKSTDGLRMPIDTFLTSLAEESGDAAACVILSGTGSDGTSGLRAIKAHGGIAIVQDSETARFTGMPDSATATGIVDFTLKPESMPKRLIDVLQHRRYLKHGDDGAQLQEDLRDRLGEVLDILAREDGHDFGNYKEGTLLRRIERRMVIQRLTSVEDLIRLLQNDPNERQTLLHDFLIGVTRFFRDEAVFEDIASRVVPQLLERDQDEFRIWVPGCSTGEEAFSLAILFHEEMRKTDDRRRIQVFGTDVDIGALRHARAGRYGATALDTVAPHLLERYFREEDGDYMVKPILREQVIFAPHNVLEDAPFSRIDLVSCRNLLIYLTRDGQKSVLSRFHYALRQSGILVLGPSESIGDFEAFFDPIDRQNRLFKRDDRRTMGYSAIDGALETPKVRTVGARALVPSNPIAPVERSLDEQADQFFLNRFAPPYIVIDSSDRVRYFSSNIGAMISPPKGQPTADLDGLLARDLRSPVRKLLQGLRAGDAPAEARNVLVSVDDQQKVVDLEADFLPGDSKHIMLTLQRVRLQGAAEITETTKYQTTREAEDLSQELDLTRRTLNATQADYESAEQELRSANEELLSMNEELQSSNEELETSREELQSINEELETINAELTENNQQMASVNGDLQNVMESTDIPTLILGDGLELRRFTFAARKLFSMDDRDIGRPITDLAAQIDYPELEEDVAAVKQTLQMVERDVTDVAGETVYQVRVRPYRGVDDRLDGSVVTFVDITQRLRFEAELKTSEERLAAALNGGRLGIYETDIETGKVYWDETSRDMWGVSRSGEVDVELAFQDIHPDDRDFVRQKFERAITPGGGGQLQVTFRLTNRKSGDTIWVYSEGSAIYEDGVPVKLIGVNKDVTEQQLIAEELKNTAARLELTYEVTGIAAFEWNVASGTSIWTPNMYDLLGCAKDREPSFALFDEFVHPDDRERVNAAVQQAMEDYALFDEDFRITRGTDGAVRVFNGKGRTIHDDDGNPVAMIGINFDKTDAVEDEEHRDLLTNELNHRVKNSLAVIQSIARQTLRNSTDIESFGERFLGRLQAIARAHDILINDNEYDTPLSALIQSQVRPYTGNSDDQLRLSGAPVSLGASVAHALGLVLHELATNAAKYGALSVSGGALHIEWAEKTVDGRPGLELVWRETGGPRVSPPEHTGFGTRLISTSLSMSLGGDAQLDYEPDGVVATIECYLRGDDD